MFTGIIRHVGEVQAVRSIGDAKRLSVNLGPLAEGLAAGDSVAVSGACLTVCALSGSAAEFDVIPETLRRSTLDELRPGAKVNIERSLRLGDPLDGHMVQGHVDGVAHVRRIDRSGDQWVVEFAAIRALTDQMVEKGAVAIDGVSLTLTAVGDEWFRVALIPATRGATTLGGLAVGRKVNVETDVLGKYVRRRLEQPGGGYAGPPPGRPAGRAETAQVTFEKLRRAGFA